MLSIYSPWNAGRPRSSSPSTNRISRLILMSEIRAARGRPKGTGLDDRARLLAVAEMIAGNPDLKATTAIKSTGVTDPSTIRRLRDKFQLITRRADRRGRAANVTLSHPHAPSAPPQHRALQPPARHRRRRSRSNQFAPTKNSAPSLRRNVATVDAARRACRFCGRCRRPGDPAALDGHVVRHRPAEPQQRCRPPDFVRREDDEYASRGDRAAWPGRVQRDDPGAMPDISAYAEITALALRFYSSPKTDGRSPSGRFFIL